ncbi:MAG: flavodoxin domain-containing protein [Anaerolineales bacterium]|nr:flavodoxin domain-containing protein [Anaerolineales bacterium]
MQTKVLVVYASKHGATKEIAEKIGETLTNMGIDTSIVHASEATDLTNYSTIILGSAVYIGQWQKPAVSFLKKNVELLSGKDVWIFSSGPSGEGDPVELLQGWRFPNSIKEEIDKIQPRDITVFHGNLDHSKLNFFEKWITGKVNAAVGDFRNWAVIKTWAETIGRTLVS